MEIYTLYNYHFARTTTSASWEIWKHTSFVKKTWVATGLLSWQRCLVGLSLVPVKREAANGSSNGRGGKKLILKRNEARVRDVPAAWVSSAWSCNAKYHVIKTWSAQMSYSITICSIWNQICNLVQGNCFLSKRSCDRSFASVFSPFFLWGACRHHGNGFQKHQQLFLHFSSKPQRQKTQLSHFQSS